jgi:hypothetical protein
LSIIPKWALGSYKNLSEKMKQKLELVNFSMDTGQAQKNYLNAAHNLRNGLPEKAVHPALEGAARAAPS